MSLNSYNALFASIRDTLFWALIMFLTAMLVVATVEKHQQNQSAENAFLVRVAPTIESSKEQGLFNRLVIVTPKQFEIDGKKVEVDQAWIEQTERINNSFIWFSEKIVTGYRLCINLKSGGELFVGDSGEYNFKLSNSNQVLSKKLGNRLFSLNVTSPLKNEYELVLVQTEGVVGEQKTQPPSKTGALKQK